MDKNKVWTGALPYFPESELACKGTGIIKLDIRFAVQLQAARQSLGKPLTPSSVCRTPAHNENEGGHKHSMHLTENPKWDTWGTCAADIEWYKWTINERLEFARFMFHEYGFSIGLHNSFCHIDLRTVAGLRKSVFLYGSWNKYFTTSDVRRKV